MMIVKRIIFLFCVVTAAWCQFEVIKISDGLSGKTANYLWPVLKNGGVTVNKHEVIIPDGSSLYIQNRKPPFDYTLVNLKHAAGDVFTVYRATVNKDVFAYAVVGGDGRRYLFKRERNTDEILGYAMRHGISAERMFLLQENRLLATGLYRPALIEFVDRYKNESLAEQRKNAKTNFDPLYKHHKAYTLSLYDQSMKEIDSGNVIDRTGDNARAYEGLYLTHPVDTAKGDVVFLIDNDQGYVVEKYTEYTCFDSSFEIINRSYKKLSDNLTLNDMAALKIKDRAYSVPYALYEQKGMLFCSFFQAPVWFEEIEPPYFYDILTQEGEWLSSGKLEYPLICEDDNTKIFAYVKHEGGWFESDQHYLVGMTFQDFIEGRVTNESIESSVSRFISQ